MSEIELPSPFLAEWVRKLAGLTDVPGRALDVAMGRGRHAFLLADAGFRTFGVDAKIEVVRDAVERAASRHQLLCAWCADLTVHPLPRHYFDLVIVSRYLQRDLFSALRESLVEGGTMLYETFTSAQRAHGRGPTSADHLLEPGELLSRFKGFDVMFYEEVLEPDAVARFAGRRPRLK